MCGYFYIGFIDFTLEGNSLIDYTNLLPPGKYEKKENDTKIFSLNWNKKSPLWVDSKNATVKMDLKDMSQDLRLKNIEQTKNYFIKEINQNRWIGKNHKKVYIDLNFIEQLFNYLSSAVKGCFWTYAFASLVSILIRIISFAVQFRKIATVPRTKYCKSVSK